MESNIMKKMQDMELKVKHNTPLVATGILTPEIFAASPEFNYGKTHVRFGVPMIVLLSCS
jgi:hypothetical protein